MSFSLVGESSHTPVDALLLLLTGHHSDLVGLLIRQDLGYSAPVDEQSLIKDCLTVCGWVKDQQRCMRAGGRDYVMKQALVLPQV